MDPRSPDNPPPDGPSPDGPSPDGTPPDGTPPDGTPPDDLRPDEEGPDAQGPWGDPSLPLLPLSTRLALYYILTFLVVLFGGSLALASFGDEQLWESLSAGEGLDMELQLLIEACLAVPVVLMTLAFVRFVDRKEPFEIGATWPPASGHRAVVQLVKAFLGAAAILGIWRFLAGFVATFEEVDPAVTEDGTAGVGRILLFAAGFLAAACLEEWILRGYIYSALREQLSWVNAGGVAALLYVLPQTTAIDVRASGLVNAFLIAMLLAAMREITGSLWPGVIFHGCWNALLGSFLSLPVSGIDVPKLNLVEVTGPEPWTGGAYGPEGSWLMTALLVLALIRLAGRLAVDEVDEEEEDDDGGIDF